MSVIDCGSFGVRCGYVGDSQCTQVLAPYALATTNASLHADEAAADNSDMNVSYHYSIAELITSSTRLLGRTPISPLWTTDAIQRNMQHHIDQIQYAKQSVLDCDEDSPLMMVLPELWHERLDRVASLGGQLVEGGITRSFYFARPSACWALSVGKSTSIVADVGHSHTTVAAVCDGYVLRRSIFSTPVGGSTVTSELMKSAAMRYQQTLAGKRHVEASSHGDTHRVVIEESRRRLALERAYHDVKRSCTVVALKGLKSGEIPCPPHMQQRLIAPDGSELILNGASDVSADSARSHCYEALFREGEGTTDVSSAIMKCRRSIDVDMQVSSVPQLLCGGTSQAANFGTRLLGELRARDSTYFKVASLPVAAPHGAWIGASMAAESTAFAPLWITKAEYDEEGASVFQRKLCY